MALKLCHLFVLFLLFLAIQPFIVYSRTLSSTDKSFSLQNLEGSHKGQTLKGLKEIKHYLKHFGYYPNIGKDLSDNFNDVLESALKTYQKNFNLKITGNLDSDTITQMKIPRCGVPDYNLNPKSSTPKHGSDSPFGLDYSFFPRRPKWPHTKSLLRYRFLNGIKVFDMQTQRAVTARAFSKWAVVSSFRFQEGTPANLFIGFYSGDHRDGYPFDGRGGILAHGFAPRDGRLHFDADEPWSTNPTSTEVDLESVSMHEIGHLLGLDHSMDPNAVMYPSIHYGEIKRNLTADDVKGIHALYHK